MNPEKVLAIPGSFALASNYAPYKGVDIWLKNAKTVNTEGYEWIIAHSLGVNYALEQKNSYQKKFILINPLVKKRSIPSLMWREVQYMVKEGNKGVHMIPPRHWPHAFFLGLKLLKVDVFKKLQEFPKDNIYILKGTRDTYFCDKEDIQLARKNGNTVFEVDAQHNLNENIRNKILDIIVGT